MPRNTPALAAAAAGAAGLATAALAVLRLAGAITWPWWWVLSPLWISAAAVALIFAALVAVAAFAAYRDTH